MLDFHLPSSALRRIRDADEEVYLSYIDKPQVDSGGGLGFLSPNSPVLTVEVPSGNSSTLELIVHQSPSSLKSRVGDTGSVLWRVSVLFARLVLSSTSPVFDRSSHVYELGSGTGFLSCALSHLVSHWTCSDLPDNLKLIRKTIAANKGMALNVSVEELDWTAKYNDAITQCKRPDIVLATDCLFNENLLEAFVGTVKKLNPRIFLLVQELRSEEVMREFLEIALREWEDWDLYAVDSKKFTVELGSGKYVVWFANNRK